MYVVNICTKHNNKSIHLTKKKNSSPTNEIVTIEPKTNYTIVSSQSKINFTSPAFTIITCGVKPTPPIPATLN